MLPLYTVNPGTREGIVLSGGNAANVMRHYTDALAGRMNLADWRQMFEAALQGRVSSRQLDCPDAPGRCVMRLGSLAATGWPVGVLYSEDEMTAPLRAHKTRIALAGLLTLLLMAAAVAVVTRRLTRPLAALAQASDHIARGDLEAPLPPARASACDIAGSNPRPSIETSAIQVKWRSLRRRRDMPTV